ncbi:MlaD family protein [Roseateles sp.]|uniref:MlaD family protein n=1 Tax=Roseateles sp. TaxID=1971397 RepID=UPI002DFDCF4F|nr:MlaD family protein [Roseateles sp.]
MTRRRANPLVIGAFVAASLALLAAALIALPGNHWFKRPQRAVMFFSGSVYGLQKGAPVVFRGVHVGDVTEIRVYYDSKTDGYAIPVIAELDDDAIRDLEGERTHGDIGHALPTLIARGLTAQLGTQSLVTGQLYVDLDLRPKQRGALRGGYQGDATEIPTTATVFQALKSQLDGIDLRRILDDLSQISSAAHAFVTGPELKQGLKDFAEMAAHARRLAAQLDQRAAPLSNGAQRALASVDRAGNRVSDAANRLGRGADRASELLDPNGTVVRDLRRALDELGRASASLRETADSDGPLLQQTERTMRDLSSAARALRQLADSLEAQPESLLRGRRPDPRPAEETAR